ncbi:LCP family protein [Micromonospora sp. WMMD1102]|uniref:LCP family protein n=1 Tax=Micromonospora sp. WMMD1102 TaxID=3016105 RepID=UPI00241592FC|nr:LCP family protein [Micromonospora sp. WMMD1102]MDG4790819.1 LCP family protein [Micromonospora sp. WMMD1102]
MPVQSRRRPPRPASTVPPSRATASVGPSPLDDWPEAPNGPGGKAKGGKGSGGKGGKSARRRRTPLWARLTVIFGAVLMLSSGVAIAGMQVAIDQATSTIQQENLLGGAGKSEAEGGKDLDGPIDLLLLGIDARARLDADNVRADTIIVLHIPATHDQAYLLSIPRDTEVQVPAFKKSRYGGGTAKATEAFYHGAQNGGGLAGGAQLMAATVNKLTGISFDGAAIINFSGFKKIIDALGTIPMCVRHEVKSHHMKLVDGEPMWNHEADKARGVKKPVVHKKGCRQMEGWEALDYSRQRYGLPRGDYDRQQNQQQLIKAMAKKAMSDGVMTDIGKLNQLMKAAGEALIVDTGRTPIADFIFTMRGVAANDLVLLRTNDGNFAGNGSGRETLKPISQQMFAAVKNDRLDEFIINNPTVLASTK